MTAVKSSLKVSQKITPKITIIVDNREKNPYTFKSIDPPPEIISQTLQEGDYSLYNHEKEITIERKSLIDAFGTFGKNRKRFERELERMVDYKFSAVVIEGGWTDILRSPPPRSKLNPTTIFHSVVAWCQRYNVHFFTVPNRAFGEKLTYRLIERFWRDINEK